MDIKNNCTIFTHSLIQYQTKMKQKLITKFKYIFQTDIVNDIIAEKQQAKPDKFYIQQCQDIIDKDLLDFKGFIDTGRIVTKEDFKNLYPNITLNKKTQSVVRYVGGLYIEILKVEENKIWKTNGRRYKTLGRAEKRLWEDKFSKLSSE